MGDMSRTAKIVLAIVGVVVLGVLGVYGFLLFVKDDGPAALDQGDLDQALVTTTVAGGTDASPTTIAGPTTTDAAAPAGLAGSWTINADSVVGYRVQEVLGGIDTEGVGRTNKVTGTLALDGDDTALTLTTATFEVDMASVTSDSDRRDGQYRSRIMSTDEFPTSTFTLTAPIELGAAPAEGATVEATATGDLTLRGVTRSVTFPLTAKLEGGRIGVLGSIPILFSEYEIPPPSNSFAIVKDDGLLEFVLVFER